MLQQREQPHGVFVRGALGVGADAPDAAPLAAVMDGEDDVGVAGVDDEDHGHAFLRSRRAGRDGACEAGPGCRRRWHRRHVPGDDAAGADHGVLADRHAGQDDRATADPGERPDADGSAELQPGPAQRRVARVVGGVDLHRGADLDALADLDRHHVQDDAAEVQERIGAEADVEAVVAMERRPDHAPVADGAEPLGQERPALGRGSGRGGVVPRPASAFAAAWSAWISGVAGPYSAPASIFCFSVAPRRSPEQHGGRRLGRGDDRGGEDEEQRRHQGTDRRHEGQRRSAASNAGCASSKYMTLITRR